MSKKQLNVTKVYWDIDKAFKSKNKYRNILLVGGSRSSKTYSLCQYLISLALQSSKDTTITEVDIVRKSFPSLRATVLKDFLNILQNDLGIYDENKHQKVEQKYTLNNFIFNFYSVDDPMKIHGRSRDILWINEANEIDDDTYTQLAIRTRKLMFYDFNPRDVDCWVNTKVSIREDSVSLHSTYKDNKFLTQTQIEEIENLKNTDENYYQVYCLGNYSASKTKIFNHWSEFDVLPNTITEYTYGIDFGFNHPTALVECAWSVNGECFVSELIYESGLTSQELVNRLKTFNLKGTLYGDYARPEIIEDIRRAGINIENADKNVKNGIDKVKTTKLFISKTSINLLNEIKKYAWKTDKNGKLIDEPVKKYDDAVDAMRYGISSRSIKPKYSGEYLIY